MSVLAIIAALPVSGPMDSAQCFASLHYAMASAAHAALSVSAHFEVGGAIYSLDGRYCYTAPVTQGKAEEIDYRVQIPKGAVLSALWHTHPIGHSLSAQDKELSKRLHVPMYVVAIESHSVIGYETFPLDVEPIQLETVVYNGVRYIVRGDYLEAPNGHLYMRQK